MTCVFGAGAERQTDGASGRRLGHSGPLSSKARPMSCACPSVNFEWADQPKEMKTSRIYPNRSVFIYLYYIILPFEQFFRHSIHCHQYHSLKHHFYKNFHKLDKCWDQKVLERSSTNTWYSGQGQH